MITITTLACHRDRDMAILSLKSFIHNYKDAYEIHVYEDGSLTEEDKILFTALPNLIIKDKKEVDAKANEALKKYPFCKAWRGENAFTVKLFDMAVVEENDYVYFDSDIFFIRPFTGLERRQFGEEDLVLMYDRFDYYSLNYFERFIYPRVKFPDKINAGFYYLKKEAIDWDLFEWLFSQQQYFPRDKELWRVSLADQTAWALLGANSESKIFKKKHIIIPAGIDEITNETVAVHLIKRLKAFPEVYEHVQSLMFRENIPTTMLEVEDLKFSNLFTAAFERIKFKFYTNK